MRVLHPTLLTDRCLLLPLSTLPALRGTGLRGRQPCGSFARGSIKSFSPKKSSVTQSCPSPSFPSLPVKSRMQSIPTAQTGVTESTGAVPSQPVRGRRAVMCQPIPGESGTERSLLQGCLGLNLRQLGDKSVGQVAESLCHVCSGPVQDQAK